MTANFLVHKTKPWSEVLHHWQVRIITGFTLLHSVTPRVEFDSRFPTLALVVTEEPLEEEEIEHAFRNSPEEMEHLALHIFPELPEGVPMNRIFDAASEVLGIPAM